MLNIILLGITSLLTDISSEMVYPLLPLYLTTLGATPAILGFIEGIAESIASLLKVFSGYFSDKFKKRKPLTVLGYAISALGKVLLFLSYSWTYVFSARVFDRFGKGVRTAPRDALISETAASGKRGSLFGLHRAMDTLGAVLGIILAYYFLRSSEGNFKRVFLYAIFPALLAILFLFFVREKRKQEPKTSIAPKLNLFKEFKNLDKRLKKFLLITCIFTLGNSSNQFLLLRAKDLGFSIYTVILLYLVYNIVYCLFSWPLGKLSDLIGRKKVLIAGYLIYGLVYLGFALVKDPVFVWVLFGIYGLYIGISEGVEKALVSDLSDTHIRATALGCHATLQGIGLFPASFIAGILWTNLGASSPFIFGGIMALLATWLLYKLI